MISGWANLSAPSGTSPPRRFKLRILFRLTFFTGFGIQPCPPPSRRVFLAMALTMPRWLWPEPPKPPGHVLPPQARPRFLQARALLFGDSDFDALLTTLMPEDESTAPPPSPPRVPGLLQHSDCRRLLQAGKQGRLTAAWKQLFSYGVAPADKDTAERLRAKWLPAPLFPTELRGSYSTTATARASLTPEAIQQAASRLTTGSATDALGWSHESWSRAFQLPHDGENWATREKTC